MASRKRAGLVLCLIVCGETIWGRERRIGGATDLPLSPAGRASVTADVERIQTGRLGTIYHPDTEASAETAHLLAAVVGARTRAIPELAEPNLGVLEGLSEQAFADRYTKRHRQWLDDPLSLTPPQGEPMAEAQARIFAAVARAAKRCRSDELGIVLAPLGMGLLRCWLADRPARELWSMLRDHPRIERYLITPAQVKQLERAAPAVRLGA